MLSSHTQCSIPTKQGFHLDFWSNFNLLLILSEVNIVLSGRLLYSLSLIVYSLLYFLSPIISSSIACSLLYFFSPTVFSLLYFLLLWLGKIAKSLFIFFFFSFSFLFLFELTIQERSARKYYITNITHYSHMLGCYRVISYVRMSQGYVTWWCYMISVGA